MLKFHAKPGGMTAWPNSHFGGQSRRYVGREFKRLDDKTVAYPAKVEPDQVADNDADAQHLIRKVVRGELYAADQHTADACGVAFMPLESDQDGEWFPKASKKTDPRPAAASKD